MQLVFRAYLCVFMIDYFEQMYSFTILFIQVIFVNRVHILIINKNNVFYFQILLKKYTLKVKIQLRDCK